MNRYNRIWVAYRTLVVKEVRRFSRIWIQTVLPAIITTLLYFVIFGNLIGRHIGPMSGMDYAHFIVPGLIMMTAITNSYANVVSSFYSSKFQRFIDEMLIAPVPDWVILAGYVTGGMARGLTVALAVTLVSLNFVEVLPLHPGFSFVIILLTTVLFSIGGFINAIFANSFDDISIVPTFILGPLTYLGGVFYSIDMLDELWRGVSLFNPILYIINAFRYGFYGVTDVSIALSLTVILGLVMFMMLWALWLLKRGVGLKH